MTNTIHSVMKAVLIGKDLKYAKIIKGISQPFNVYRKKSNGVTDKQFESKNPRFVNVVSKNVWIGRHIVFDYSKIVDIQVETGNHESYNYLIVVLENGHETVLEVDAEIIDIDRDTIMFKNNY
jgi:hypothetical protein